MKKYLLLGILAISSISFAWGRHYDNDMIPIKDTYILSTN